MAVYADFTYYDETYLGIAIAETDYPRLEKRASEQINRLTHQRAASDTENTDAIKMATCAIAEKIQAVEASGGSIKSEGVGDGRVSYSENSDIAKSPTEQYQNAARVYLGSTGLMFAGFIEGEYAN